MLPLKFGARCLVACCPRPVLGVGRFPPRPPLPRPPAAPRCPVESVVVLMSHYYAVRSKARHVFVPLSVIIHTWSRTACVTVALRSFSMSRSSQRASQFAGRLILFMIRTLSPLVRLVCGVVGVVGSAAVASACRDLVSRSWASTWLTLTFIVLSSLTRLSMSRSSTIYVRSFFFFLSKQCCSTVLSDCTEGLNLVRRMLVGF